MKRTLKDYWSANDDDVGIGLGSKKVCVEDVEADRDHNVTPVIRMWTRIMKLTWKM